MDGAGRLGHLTRRGASICITPRGGAGEGVALHSISNQLLGAVRDPARLRALHLTQLLDSPPEESFDRFTRLAARVTKAPVSLVTLVDEDRQFFKSCLGLPEPWASDRETPLSHSFCQHVVAQGEPLIVTDARTDARLHDNLAIRDLDVVAYAGWPVLAPDGSVLGSFCVIDSQPREWTEEELANLADIAGSVNAEIAFRHTLVAEHTARQEAVQANLRLRFVAEASTLLTQTLDADRVLQELAKIAVPALADWCIIDVAEGPFLHRRAFAHAGAGREAIAAELSNYPPRTDSPAGPGRAFRVGGPEIVAPVTSEWIEGKAQDARHRELLYAMGMDSAAFVPLVVKRRAIGVMTFVSSDPARRYTEDDLEVFVGLARHTALAVENARLYAERDNVARTLQKTLLPPAMPQVPGYDLAVAYEPSGAGNEVGGDFYDAFRNAWGDWVIAIGDVCGKGVHAAVITGLVRHALRAAATDHRDPEAIARMINRVLCAHEAVGGSDRFCSLLLATLCGGEGDGDMALVSAGHPPPLVRRADGRVEEPRGSGMLLGMFEEVDLSPVTLTVHEGDVVLAYTDGVTEARGRESRELFGHQRLVDVVAAADGGAGAVTSAVVRAVRQWQGSRAQDDIALLAVGRAGRSPQSSS